MKPFLARIFPNPLPILLGVLLCGLATQCIQAESDFQFRPSVEVSWLRWHRLTLVNFAEGTFSDRLENPTGYYASVKGIYDAATWLQIGVNGSRLEAQLPDPDGGEFHNAVWRSEIDVTPRIQLADRWSIQLRNRAEWRWPDGGDGPKFRSRHRLQLSLRVDNLRPLTGLYSYYEYFQDWDLKRDGEHRLTPLGLEWRLGERVKLRSGYEWRTRLVRGQWFDSHILMTGLQLDLR